MSGLFGDYSPEWTEINRYAPTCADGHEAIVYESRMPARFYRIVCAEEGIDLATGSGSAMRDLSEQIANAIADGMLGITEETP